MKSIGALPFHTSEQIVNADPTAVGLLVVALVGVLLLASLALGKYGHKLAR